ncbi:MAG: flippase-like domain-containing protein [Oligoflexia bacterium]|nr:flippase-like domain-containing protein [Oligoflexia bacterium]
MKLKGFIKLILSVVMLALVLRLVELKNLHDVIFRIPASTAVAVLIGYILGQVLSALKWWTICRKAGIESNFLTALKAYFIGMFVNCFGFGTVGGDVARALLLNDRKSARATSLASVVADRAHGLAVLACIGSCAIGWWGRSALEPSLVYLLYSLPILVVLGWALAPTILTRLVPEGTKFGTLVRDVVRVFPRDLTTVSIITVMSILFHLLQIGLHAVIVNGVGADIPWSTLLTVIPFVNILATLPISWNGLGVRENAYKFMLVPAFLSPEQAVALGAIWLLAVVIASGVGGIVSVLTKDIEVVENAENTDTVTP